MSPLATLRQDAAHCKREFAFWQRAPPAFSKTPCAFISKR